MSTQDERTQTERDKEAKRNKRKLILKKLEDAVIRTRIESEEALELMRMYSKAVEEKRKESPGILLEDLIPLSAVTLRAERNIRIVSDAIIKLIKDERD